MESTNENVSDVQIAVDSSALATPSSTIEPLMKSAGSGIATPRSAFAAIRHAHNTCISDNAGAQSHTPRDLKASANIPVTKFVSPAFLKPNVKVPEPLHSPKSERSAVLFVVEGEADESSPNGSQENDEPSLFEGVKGGEILCPIEEDGAFGSSSSADNATKDEQFQPDAQKIIDIETLSTLPGLEGEPCDDEPGEEATAPELTAQPAAAAVDVNTIDADDAPTVDFILTIPDDFTITFNAAEFDGQKPTEPVRTQAAGAEATARRRLAKAKASAANASSTIAASRSSTRASSSSTAASSRSARHSMPALPSTRTASSSSTRPSSSTVALRAEVADSFKFARILPSCQEYVTMLEGTTKPHAIPGKANMWANVLRNKDAPWLERVQALTEIREFMLDFARKREEITQGGCATESEAASTEEDARVAPSQSSSPQASTNGECEAANYTQTHAPTKRIGEIFGCTLATCLAVQLADLRSAVVTQACLTVETIAKVLRDCFDPVAQRILLVVADLAKVTKKPVAQAGESCLETIIMNTAPLPSLSLLIDLALVNRSDQVRRVCLDNLALAASSWPRGIIERRHEHGAQAGYQLLSSLEALVPHALADASAAARASARSLVAALYARWPRRTNILITRLVTSSGVNVSTTAAEVCEEESESVGVPVGARNLTTGAPPVISSASFKALASQLPQAPFAALILANTSGSFLSPVASARNAKRMSINGTPATASATATPRPTPMVTVPDSPASEEDGLEPAPPATSLASPSAIRAAAISTLGDVAVLSPRRTPKVCTFGQEAANNAKSAEEPINDNETMPRINLEIAFEATTTDDAANVNTSCVALASESAMPASTHERTPNRRLTASAGSTDERARLREFMMKRELTRMQKEIHVLKAGEVLPGLAEELSQRRESLPEVGATLQLALSPAKQVVDRIMGPTGSSTDRLGSSYQSRGSVSSTGSTPRQPVATSARTSAASARKMEILARRAKMMRAPSLQRVENEAAELIKADREAALLAEMHDLELQSRLIKELRAATKERRIAQKLEERWGKSGAGSPLTTPQKAIRKSSHEGFKDWIARQKQEYQKLKARQAELQQLAQNDTSSETSDLDHELIVAESKRIERHLREMESLNEIIAEEEEQEEEQTPIQAQPANVEAVENVEAGETVAPAVESFAKPSAENSDEEYETVDVIIKHGNVFTTMSIPVVPESDDSLVEVENEQPQHVAPATDPAVVTPVATHPTTDVFEASAFNFTPKKMASANVVENVASPSPVVKEKISQLKAKPEEVDEVLKPLIDLCGEMDNMEEEWKQETERLVKAQRDAASQLKTQLLNVASNLGVTADESRKPKNVKSSKSSKAKAPQVATPPSKCKVQEQFALSPLRFDVPDTGITATPSSGKPSKPSIATPAEVPASASRAAKSPSARLCGWSVGKPELVLAELDATYREEGLNPAPVPDTPAGDRGVVRDPNSARRATSYSGLSEAPAMPLPSMAEAVAEENIPSDQENCGHPRAPVISISAEEFDARVLKELELNDSCKTEDLTSTCAQGEADQVSLSETAELAQIVRADLLNRECSPAEIRHGSSQAADERPWEAPIVPASPEEIKESIRRLITPPHASSSSVAAIISTSPNARDLFPSEPEPVLSEANPKSGLNKAPEEASAEVKAQPVDHVEAEITPKRRFDFAVLMGKSIVSMLLICGMAYLVIMTGSQSVRHDDVTPVPNFEDFAPYTSKMIGLNKPYILREVSDRYKEAVEAFKGWTDAFANEIATYMAELEREAEALGETADSLVSMDAEAEARNLAEEEARIRAEEEARIRVEEEARVRAEEEARIRAEDEARIRAEEEARIRAEEEARIRTEEEARVRAEEEARIRAEEEARIRAEEEARIRAEEEARIRAEEEARIRAEEEARIRAEEEAWIRAEEERINAKEARIWAEEQALLQAEEEARLQADLEAKARAEVEMQALEEEAALIAEFEKLQVEQQSGQSVIQQQQPAQSIDDAFDSVLAAQFRSIALAFFGGAAIIAAVVIGASSVQAASAAASATAELAESIAKAKATANAAEPAILDAVRFAGHTAHATKVDNVRIPKEEIRTLAAELNHASNLSEAAPARPTRRMSTRLAAKVEAAPAVPEVSGASETPARRITRSSARK